MGVMHNSFVNDGVWVRGGRVDDRHPPYLVSVRLKITDESARAQYHARR